MQPSLFVYERIRVDYQRFPHVYERIRVDYQRFSQLYERIRVDYQRFSNFYDRPALISPISTLRFGLYYASLHTPTLESKKCLIL